MSIESTKTALRAQKEANLERLSGDESNMTDTQKQAVTNLRSAMAYEADHPNDTIPPTQSVGHDPTALPYGIRSAKQDPPVINSPLAVNAEEGTGFAYQITATKQPYAFNAYDLPTGWAVNPDTGFVTCGEVDAAQVGTVSLTIEATNQGGTDSKTLVVTVAAAE